MQDLPGAGVTADDDNGRLGRKFAGLGGSQVLMRSGGKARLCAHVVSFRCVT